MKYEIGINAEELKKAMDNCKFAVSKDKYRQEMQKIRFKINKDTLQILSIDGFRLHTQTINIYNDSSDELEFLTDYIKVPKTMVLSITLDTELKTITYDFKDINEKIIKSIYDIGNYPKDLDKLKDGHKTKYRIAINPKYLIEALKGFKDMAIIDFDDPIKPIIIRAKNDNINYNLVLPIRLPDDEKLDI